MSGRMPTQRNACTNAAARQLPTGAIIRRRLALKRRRVVERLCSSRRPPQRLIMHSAVVSDDGAPFLGIAPTMRAIYAHYEGKSGGDTDIANTDLHRRHVPLVAQDGHGEILQKTRQLANGCGSAPASPTKLSV